MAHVQINMDHTDAANISMAQFQQLMQAVQGAVALSRGPIILEWTPRDWEQPVKVTTITDDGTPMFRRSA